MLLPDVLIEAGTPNPCTDSSFVSIFDDVVVSPNILLNLKFSFSLKNLTLPVCWSVVIEFAYHPFVSVSVKVAICSGVYPLSLRTFKVVPAPKDGVKVKSSLLVKLCAEDKIKLFWSVTVSTVTVPEIPPPVTMSFASIVPTLVSTTKVVEELVVPFTLAVLAVPP